MKGSRRNATTLVLILFVIGLAQYLNWDRKHTTTVESDTRQRNLLPVFRRDDLKLLRLERLARVSEHGPDGGTDAVASGEAFSAETITLTRGPDDEIYLQGDPRKSPAADPGKSAAGGDPKKMAGAPPTAEELADTAAVRKLLTAFEFVTPERAVGSELDRTRMGLDAPRLRAHLEMGRVIYDISIGAPAPTPEGAAYGELRSQGIAVGGWFVVSRDFVDALTLPRDTYRDRTLVDLPISDLERIELHGKGGDRALVRQPWGWGLEDPLGPRGRTIVRADRDSVETVVAALADLRADAFPSPGGRDLAGAPRPDGAAVGEGVRIVLTGKRDAKRAFVVGGTCVGHEGAVAIEREGSPPREACVTASKVSPFEVEASSLVDRHLVSLRSSEIELIELAGPGGRWELVRAGIGWHVRAPDEGALDAAVGNVLATSLAESIGEPSRLSEPRDGADGARVHVRVVRAASGEARDGGGAGSSDEETLDIGPPEADGSAWVHRGQDDAWLKFRRRVIAALAPSPLRTRSLAVLTLDAGQILEVEVRGREVVQRLLRADDGSWRLGVPSAPRPSGITVVGREGTRGGFGTDGELAHDLIDSLTGLRAALWIAERSDGTFGLEAPQTTVDIKSSSEGKVAVSRIELGDAADGGGVYARRRDDGAVFVLDAQVVRALRTPVIDRTLVPPPLPADARIWFDGPSGRMAIAGDLRASVERVLDGLHARAALHVGAPKRDEGFSPGALRITFEPSSASPALALRFGGQSDWNGVAVRYVRRSDVDATFVLPEELFTSLAAAGKRESEPKPPSRP